MARLELIHDGAKSSTAPNVVFLHGLNGHARETWMHNPKDHTTLWPKWVAEDADCITWVLGYDAAASSWTDSAMHLPEQGVAALNALSVEPRLHGRPLVLVGHSMGGLVIKEAVVHAVTHDDPRLKGLLADLAAVVFVATPHQGADLATLAIVLGSVLKTNPQVGNMQSNDVHLKKLNGQFRTQCKISGIQVRVFYETHPIIIKKKFFGLTYFQKSVLVVNCNSSDPAISGFTPIPIPANHISIAKPASREADVHRTLLSLLTDIQRQIPAPTALQILAESLPLTVVPNQITDGLPQLTENLNATRSNEIREVSLVLNRFALLQQIHRASHHLLSWPSTLPGGGWLERPELDDLYSRIRESQNSLTLVLGEPGCGKSALLARLGQTIQENGGAVLGIKADRLPEDTLNQQMLTQYLELSAPILATVRALADEGPVVVLLDQLDALADLVVQRSARLRVLLDLIRDLHAIQNVHIVATCRSFEQRHDPSLRNLEAHSINLQLPRWEDVDAVLQAHGLQAGGWNPEMRETLRSPHALDTFLTLLDNTGELSVLHSFQSMLQVQWESKVLCDASGGRKALLLDLARVMASREVLGLPLVQFEDRYSTVQELEAAGLLRLETGGGRIEFRHQTLYEFVRARSFLDEVGSLTEAVSASQSSLRIRPQLWHALAYLREADPDQYQVELGLLWQADLRPHLRMLLIEFLGRQAAPLAQEEQLALQSFDDPWFQRRFLNAVVGSPGWFEQLAHGHIPMLMARAVTEAAAVVPIHNQALSFAPVSVLRLLDNHWLPSPDKDELSWRVLAMGHVAPQDATWIDRLVQILMRTDLAGWAIAHVASTVSMVLPHEAPRLVAAWLARQWQKMQAETVFTPAVNFDSATKPDAATGYSSSLGKKVTSLLEARELHDLPAIAEAAPQAFIETIWPIFLELLESITDATHPSVVGYRQTHGLVTALDDDEDSRLERPFLEAIRQAVNTWADVQPEMFLAFVKDQEGHDLLPVQRLLARGMARCAPKHPARALEFLCADPRRLVLGTYSDVHRDSINLIQAVAPHLNDAQFQRLERAIMDWRRYSKLPDDDAPTRRERLMWGRMHRLRLLRALPEQRVSEVLRRFLNEEERAFPRLSNTDGSFSGGGMIGSPVSAEQMQKGQDEDILNLFNELTDDHGWDHPRDWMRGGAIQAGRELARLAKTDAERAVRVVRALQPGKNEIPAGLVLQGLADAGYPPNDLYALVEELANKGFTSVHFRRDAAYAVSNAVNAEAPVPESLLNLLESWLVSADPASEDVTTDKKPDKEKESLIWGQGGILFHPSGNFPVLSSLYDACLKVRPPQVDRWLGILEGHLLRVESIRVWSAIGWSYFQCLRQAEPARAQAFLDRLFQIFPALLGEREIVLLMARLQHWIDPEHSRRWLELMANAGGKGAQGFGEVLMLRHALYPAEAWTRDRIVALLAMTDAATLEQRVGIAHALVHLWPDPAHRALAHRYLLPLLNSMEENVLHALGGILLTQPLVPDTPTRELLESLCLYPALLRDQRADRLSESLEPLVTAEPERVAKVANALLDQAGEAMGNIATSWYLSSESLLDIALALQDLQEPHRTAGVALFERMLEFNLPQAQEMTLSLDKRTPERGTVQPQRRRRRKTPKPA